MDYEEIVSSKLLFFKSTPPPLKEAACVLPSFYSHLLRCLHRSFYSTPPPFFFNLFAVKHSIKEPFGSAPSQKCVSVKSEKQNKTLIRFLKLAVKITGDNYVTPHPHL